MGQIDSELKHRTTIEETICHTICIDCLLRKEIALVKTLIMVNGKFLTAIRSDGGDTAFDCNSDLSKISELFSNKATTYTLLFRRIYTIRYKKYS